MAHIRIVDEHEATGPLAMIYNEAHRRAGRVFNILKIQSQNPAGLASMIGFYTNVFKGESPLSRAQREMLATVVSKTNRCVY